MGKKKVGDNLAERRMFAKTIIDSDAFLDMPLSSQALYFHLSMRADDDGFLNNAKKITRTVGANQNDYDLLLVKGFIIPFEDGICVIKHWRIHNYIRNDRYKPTVYQDEKSRLYMKENNTYTLTPPTVDTVGIPNDNQMETQVRLGKGSIGKDRLGEDSIEIVEDSKDKETITKVLNSYAPNGSDLRNALNEFKEMRSKMNRPLTVRALKQALSLLDKLSGHDEITKIAIVDQTLNKGWKSFYKLQIESTAGYKKTQQTIQEGADELANYLDEMNGWL